MTYYADRRIAPGTAWVTGANKPDTHVTNAVAGRDFAVERYLDVADVEPGDPAHGAVRRWRWTGRSRSVTSSSSAASTPTRSASTCWARRQTATSDDGQLRHRGQPGGRGDPRAEPRRARPDLAHGVAPADVHLVAVGKAGQREAAEQLAAELSGTVRGCSSTTGGSRPDRLLRRRPAGHADHRHVGKSLADGEVEVKDRRSGERSAEARRGARRPAGAGLLR